MTTQRCLVLDIETALDRAASERAERTGPRAYQRPWLHRVVAVSTLAFIQEAQNAQFSDFQLDTTLACEPMEEVSLLEFVEDRLDWLGPSGTLITWNGQAHDIPILAGRRLHHWMFASSWLDRLDGPGRDCEDLMHCFGSRARWPALADVCAALDVPCNPMPRKKTTDRTLLLAAKGQTDVVATFLLHCYWTARLNASLAFLITGWVSVADYLLASSPREEHLSQFATAPAALRARTKAKLLRD